MHIFDYDMALDALLTPEISGLLSSIHEFKGKQEFFLKVQDDILNGLMEISRLHSIESSNRIEGVCTPSYRFKYLVRDNAEPRDDDELAISGYNECFGRILDGFADIPPSAENLLALHRQLLSKTQTPGGEWKTADAAITEIDGNGQQSVRFRTVPVAETPIAMQLLCNALLTAMERRRHDPLLLSVVFVFDFLCIHPFQDGNGRMSRLLLQLLMLRADFSVGRFVSIDKFIEEGKTEYYDALRASSRGWHDSANDLKPYVVYILGVILKAYREFAARVEDILADSRVTKSERIKNIIDASSGTITKREILEKCPDASKLTVESTLRRLVKEGYIATTQAGPSAAYVRIKE